MKKDTQDNFAVIKVNGKQYLVAVGDEIVVNGTDEKSVKSEVLMVVKNGKVSVGKPVVKGAKVNLKFLGKEKGKKVDVVKYKAKSRYRKKIGFRSKNLRLLVQSL